MKSNESKLLTGSLPFPVVVSAPKNDLRNSVAFALSPRVPKSTYSSSHHWFISMTNLTQVSRYFHADPHPGDVLAQKKEKEKKKEKKNKDLQVK